MKSNRTQKLVSVLVAGCFLLSDIATAAPPLHLNEGSRQITPTFMNIEIPHDLAKVEEIYEAPAKVDPSLIVHIQNAHGNYDAQVKTRKLLKHLYEKYDFRLFFVEGAVDRIEPDLLRLFPTNEQNLEVADLLAKEGKLTGTEFFMVDAPADAQAVGIENPELYRENYRAFHKVYENKEATDAFLAKISKRLVTLSSNHFSSDLRKLVLEWRMFEKGRRDFLPYVEKLAKEAKDYLDIDLRSLYAQVAWPQLTRLLMLQSMEKALDMEAGKREKEEVLTFLRRHGASKELMEAIQDIEERHIRINRLEPEDKRKENLPRYVIERLIEEMGSKGFNFLDYPDFSLYIGYFSLKNEVDSRDLFLEIEILFQQILDSLAKTNEEKILLGLFRDEVLIQKLFSLELTRENWDRFLRRQEQLKLENLLAKIKNMDQGANEIKLNPEIQNVYETAMTFYHLARQRESIFYYMVKQGMITETADKSVLLTGGFHTEGVFERFRDEQVNYGILMPQVSGDLSKDAYVTAMMDADRGLFEAATIEPPLATNVNPGLVGADFLRLRLQGVIAALTINHRNLKDPARDVFYNAFEFADAISKSPYAHTSGIQLVYPRDVPKSDVQHVYVVKNGKFETVNDDGKNFVVFQIGSATRPTFTAAGDMIQTVYPVIEAAVTTTTIAPSANLIAQVSEQSIILPPAQETRVVVPADFLATIDETPDPATTNALDAYAASQAEATSVSAATSGTRQQQAILGVDLLNLLNLINIPELLSQTQGITIDRDDLLALVSTIVSLGFLDNSRDFTSRLRTLTEISQLGGLNRPMMDQIMDAMLKSASGFVSAEAGDAVFVNDRMLSDERIEALAAQLVMNPNLRVYFVLGGDEKNPIAPEAESEILSKLHKKLAELKLPASNIENRLEIVIVANEGERNSALNKIEQNIRKRRMDRSSGGHETQEVGAAYFMIVAENGILLSKAPLSAVVVTSQVFSRSKLDETLQIAMGKASQILNELEVASDYKGVLLKDFNSQLLNLVYNVDEGGLSALESAIANLLKNFESTAKILQSA